MVNYEPPSPKYVQFNTKVGVTLFEVEGAHDRKEFEGNWNHYTNEQFHDGQEFEGNKIKMKHFINKYIHHGY